MVYKVIICGDRNWTDRESIKDFIKFVLPRYTVIIQGGCRGADTIAKEEAEKLGYTVITINAKWTKYGKSAGPIRNELMMHENPNWVIAFHENIDKSKGTKNMISLAEKNKTEWIICGRDGVIKISNYGEKNATTTQKTL